MMQALQPLKATPARKLALWLGGYVIVGSFLYFHFGAPLMPIGLGGLVTLGITLTRLKRNHSS